MFGEPHRNRTDGPADALRPARHRVESPCGVFRDPKGSCDEWHFTRGVHLLTGWSGRRDRARWPEGGTPYIVLLRYRSAGSVASTAGARSYSMPTWDSDVYKQFTDQRTRPAVDLAARVAPDAPARVVDLGCGPRNSTAVLARRWPRAELTGIDSSAMMLAAARAAYPAGQWVEADIAAWITDRPLDVAFSNAALQWVTDHLRVFPRLLEQVARGGALAVQVPANYDAPPHRAMRDIAQSAAWQNRFTSAPREWHVHPTEFYYDVLAPHARQLETFGQPSISISWLASMKSLSGIVAPACGPGSTPLPAKLTVSSSSPIFVQAHAAIPATTWRRCALSLQTTLPRRISLGNDWSPSVDAFLDRHCSRSTDRSALPRTNRKSTYSVTRILHENQRSRFKHLALFAEHRREAWIDGGRTFV
jgi:trans-aconitate 2-methyltransferase